MIYRQVLLASMLLLFGILAAHAQQKEADKPVTLMGMMSEWLYPDSEFGGAETSDAGVTDIVSIKSKAQFSTKDSPEQVMKFYCKKLNVDLEGRNLDEKPDERITTKRSILIQDLSPGRPGKVFLVAINSDRQSTTLVISRFDGEKMTKIGWSDYRQLFPAKEPS